MRRAPVSEPRPDEGALVAALRSGDGEAFALLVDRHHANLVRMARAWVNRQEIAEEVAQETWVAVIRGIGRFEQRCSLATWIYSIVLNLAKSRASREGRMVVFSELADAEARQIDPAVDPGRFLPDEHPRWPHHWSDAPVAWPAPADPERDLLSAEAMRCLARSLETLPPAQRQVIILRDIEGLTSEEACNVLELTETNQRVLLHRARARLRNALESYVRGGGK